MDDRTLKQILVELNEANRDLAHAVELGEFGPVDGFLRLVERLEAERNHKIARVSRPQEGYRSSVPLRDRVIQLLRLTTVATPGRLLADLSSARFLAPLDTASLSSLRRDEARRWRGSLDQDGEARAGVYVVPALSFDRFVPVRGSLALSEWPLSRRLVAPTSPRVDLLRATIAIANRAEEEGNGSTLSGVVRKLSSSIAAPRGGNAALVAAARSELDVLQERDDREREEAAMRAHEQLDDQAQLFGVQLRPVTARPGRQIKRAAS